MRQLTKYLQTALVKFIKLRYALIHILTLMRINQFNGYILYTVYQKKDLQMSIFSKIIFIDQLTCTLIKAKKQDKNDMLIKVFISFHFSFSKKRKHGFIVYAL